MVILFCFIAGTFIPHASLSLQTGDGACGYPTASFARPGVCRRSERGWGATGDGSGVGVGNEDVNGDGDGDGAGKGMGVEAIKRTQYANEDGSGDGAGTGTGLETRRQTQDGNGDRSEEGNESSSGDGNGDGNGDDNEIEDGIGEGGGEGEKRKKIHKSCRRHVGNGGNLHAIFCTNTRWSSLTPTSGYFARH